MEGGLLVTIKSFLSPEAPCDPWDDTARGAAEHATLQIAAQVKSL